MGKIKIFEIAKELQADNKEIVELANKLGIEAKSHLSAVADEEAEKIKNSFKKKNKKEEIKTTGQVIIRREVIVNEEDKKTSAHAKEATKTGIGFNTERRNKDFNIVYRDKPTKPMTVNELFGIKPKAEQKTEINETSNVNEKAEIKKETETVSEAKKSPLKASNNVEVEMPKEEVVNKKEEKVIENEVTASNDIKNNSENNQQSKANADYQHRDNSGYQNRDNNGYQRRDNNGYQNRDNNGYQRRDNNGYQNRDNNGYQRRDNSGYQNRDSNGFHRDNNGYQNRDNNGFQPRNNGYQNRENGGFQHRDNNGFQPRNNNGYQNRDNGGFQHRDNNGYQNRDNGGFQHRDNNGYQNRDNGGFQHRDNNGFQPRNNNGYQNRDNNGYQNRDNGGFQHRDNNFSNNRNGSFDRNNGFRRPMNNDFGAAKKDTISLEEVEKENKRDYSTKIIDKQKANRNLDDKKKATRSKREVTEGFDEDKLRDLKQVDKLSNMFEDQEGGMLDYYDLSTARGKRNRRKDTRRDEERNKQKIFELKEITIPDAISVKDLATELKKTSAEVVKKLFDLGIMANINQDLDFDTAYLAADAFGVTATKKEEVKDEDILFDDSDDNEDELVTRPPVVVVMGHVDHGKTSLLDAIRNTNVIEGEAGGITQHIGAYKVNVNGREITFLDTPGHEAFTSMRARGAQITDIAILVVAADDGVMPQTIEAINHAKAAGIPIIVAVNKIDLPGANVEKVKQELMKYELVPEEWGGDTIFVPISAKNNINIDTLLEMILLVADMKDLKANPNRQSKGTVIEAKLDKEQGPVASVLVQRGTLNVGDTIILGSSIGKIRIMKDDKGRKIKAAGPSTPVVITGLHDVPEAGDVFYEVKNEKVAKHLIEQRKLENREKTIANTDVVTLDNLFEKMESEDLKQFNVIVKTDVQGTAEAMKSSLEKLSNEEVRVKVIHSGAGGVTETDVQLAKAAKALIIAFNVRPVGVAKTLAEKDGVEIKQYSIIYQALEDVENAMKGMLTPIYVEKNIGNAEVRQVFKVSNVGTIAGCFVLDGKLERNAGVRVIRDNVVIHEGKLISLKRFKDDAKEVSKGFECGLQIEDYNEIHEGDTIEAYIKEEVKR